MKYENLAIIISLILLLAVSTISLFNPQVFTAYFIASPQIASLGILAALLTLFSLVALFFVLHFTVFKE